jgi:hypothetical protein
MREEKVDIIVVQKEERFRAMYLLRRFTAAFTASQHTIRTRFITIETIRMIFTL